MAAITPIDRSFSGNLASRRIRENIEKYGRSEDATTLDLSKCDLLEVPIDIIACEWLKTLILSENKQLADIYAISGLLNLQTLDISFTKVADLSPLSSLVNLQELLCGFSSIADLSPLSGLTHLQTLKCYNTQVADVSPLSGLSNLEVLNCSSTPVKDISPLLPLIEKGRRATLNGFTDKGVFDFQDCPLENPPVAVVRHGNEAILRYFGVVDKASTETIPKADKSLPQRRYPGLRSFDRSESNIFFARQREAEEFTNLVFRERLAVLFGKSGVGKTSLLQAACGPKWEQEGFVPIFIRCGSDRPLLESVGEILERSPYLSGKDDTWLRPNTTQTLWEKLKRLKFTINGSPATPVLVFDQFEEVFTLPHSEESRQEFFKELADLANETKSTALIAALFEESEQGKLDAKTLSWWESQPALRVVLSVRADFLYRLDDINIPEILNKRYQLRALTMEAARQAIVGPASVEGFFNCPVFSYSDDAISDIFGFLAGGSGQQEIEPFQLQLICQQIEEQVVDNGLPIGGEVSPVFYGGEEGLREMMDVYTRMISKLEDSEKVIARRLIEEGLIRNNRRLSVSKDQLLEEFKATPSLLEKLEDSRLLHRDTTRGEVYYEISHDTLLPYIIQFRDKRKAAEAAAQKPMGEVEDEKLKENQEAENLISRFSTPTSKYLLALEGGNAEVWGQLALLRAFEERMQKETSNRDYRLSDTFDLIGSVGLGNFVALQLALGRSAKEIYEDFKQEERNAGEDFFWVIRQVLAKRYAEAAEKRSWTTGFCYSNALSGGEPKPLTNHPDQTLSLPGILSNWANEERASHTKNNPNTSVACPVETILLHVATHAAYPFGWAVGEENLHLLSIENPTSMPDVPNQSQQQLESIAPAPTGSDTQIRLKQLAQWIHTGNKGISPLGFQPAQVTRLKLNFERMDIASRSDWERFYEQAKGIVANTDLSPFLPKVVV